MEHGFSTVLAPSVHPSFGTVLEGFGAKVRIEVGGKIRGEGLKVRKDPDYPVVPITTRVTTAGFDRTRWVRPWVQSRTTIKKTGFATRASVS